MQKHDKEKTKADIVLVAENFRTPSGNIDTSRLRKERPDMYTKIPYHFGNINNFISHMNDGINENLEGAGTTMNRDVVRNRLAYDRLKDLYEVDKMTWANIGLMYGVSKVYVNRLYNDLKRVFGDNQVNIVSEETSELSYSEVEDPTEKK